jgi:exodeoxyribonuclease VII large subunit
LCVLKCNPAQPGDAVPGNDLFASPSSAPVWQVGALCHAIADALDAKFNPITVVGEISGFTRAASGHCYWTLKDETGQLRCAMFRRAATGLDFGPKDGDKVEVGGRLSVYEARGELQLVVESLHRAGLGTLLESFFKLKQRLQSEGLFHAQRKRPLPLMPRRIGIVTSLGAAALHDVVTALQRRVPHIPVVVSPATVQGPSAPADMVRALESLYSQQPQPDVILLVRGGGSLEDLWAFNDEAMARAIVRSPVPVVSGVGHETDFTIADFVADLRAPTPTAAAEMVSQTTDFWLAQTGRWATQLTDMMEGQLDRHAQRLDSVAGRLGRPSGILQQQHVRLASVHKQLEFSVRTALQTRQTQWQRMLHSFTPAAQRSHAHWQRQTERLALQLDLLDPRLVLQRGYAWLTTADGTTLSSPTQVSAGQAITATLADGTIDLRVERIRTEHIHTAATPGN